VICRKCGVDCGVGFGIKWTHVATGAALCYDCFAAWVPVRRAAFELFLGRAPEDGENPAPVRKAVATLCSIRIEEQGLGFAVGDDDECDEVPLGDSCLTDAERNPSLAEGSF
jgi:hypothetical protein